MGVGERGEVGENLRAAGLQPPEGMMPGGDERAADAKFTCDFEVVKRIADEENFVG